MQAGADRIARPWCRSPATYWAAGIGGVLGAGGVGLVVLDRAARRREFAAALENGDRSYADVTLSGGSFSGSGRSSRF